LSDHARAHRDRKETVGKLITGLEEFNALFKNESKKYRHAEANFNAARKFKPKHAQESDVSDSESQGSATEDAPPKFNRFFQSAAAAAAASRESLPIIAAREHQITTNKLIGVLAKPNSRYPPVEVKCPLTNLIVHPQKKTKKIRFQ